MNEYIFELGVDATNLVQGFQEADKAITAMDNSVAETGKKTQAIFQKTTETMEATEKQILEVTKAYGSNEEAIAEMTAEVKRYSEIASKTFDGAQLAKYVEKIAKLEAEIAALKSGIKGAGDESKKTFTNSTKDVETLTKAIAIAKRQLDGLKPDSKEFKQLNREIQAAELGLKSLGGEGDNTEQKLDSLKKTLRETVNAMTQMKLAGLDDTEVYKRLRIEAGELRDTIGDVQAEINTAGSDTSGLDKTLRTVGALTGGFTALEGAAALFGDKNEAVQESLLRVNAAMAILQGLQTVQEELSKRDSLIKSAQIAVQNAYTAAVGTSTGALRAFRIALLATGVGAFVVLLGLLIANFDKVKEALGGFLGISGEAVENQRALNEINAKAVDIYAEEATSVRSLGKQYEKYNGDREKQKEIIQELKAISPGYFSNLKEEGELIENVSAAIEKYIEDKKLQAQAQAAYQLYVEKEKELMAQEAKSLEENISFWDETWVLITSGATPAAAAIKRVEIATENATNKTKKLTDEAERYFNQYVKLSSQVSDMGLDNEERQRKDIEQKKKGIDLLLAQAKEGSANELRLKKQSVIAQRDLDLNNAKLTETDKAIIIAKANKELVGLDKQYSEKYKALTLERLKAEEDARKKIVEIVSQIDDAKIAVMKDGAAKEKEELTKNYRERIAAIEAEAVAETNRIKNNKNISLEEIKIVGEANNKRKELVVALKAQEAKELNDIDVKYVTDSIARNLQYEAEILQLNEDSVQNRIAIARNEAEQTIQAAKEEYKDFPEILNDIVTATYKKLNEDIKQITLDGALNRIAIEEEVALKTADLIDGRANNARSKEKLITEIQLSAAKQRLAALLKQYDTEGKILIDKIQEQFSQQNIQLAAEKNVDIFELLGIDLKGTPEHIAEAKKLILDAIKSLQTGVKQQIEQGRFNIDDFLGIPEGGFMQSIDATKQAVTAVLDILERAVEQKIALKQQEIDTLTEQINTAESELQRELQFQEKGYANAVDAKKKEVNELKKQRDKALEDQKANQKEQAKLAVAAQAVAFASSTANLIQAVSNIFEQYSEIPYVGVALAIAAAAGLVGSFISLSDSVKAYNKLEKGGVIGGKRHSQGGNKFVSADGMEGWELEAGEHVTNRQSTEKHLALLEAINSDTLVDMSDYELRKLLRGTGVHLSDEDKTAPVQTYYATTNHTGSAPRNNNGETLELIEQNTRQLLELEKNKPVITDHGDYYIIQQGTHTSKVFKHKKEA